MAETCRLRESEEITPEKIKAYGFVLQGVDPIVIDRAMQVLMQVSVWFPTAAEIRDECRRVVVKMQAELEHARFKNQRLLEDQIKSERFDGQDGQQPTKDELRAEFKEMLEKAKLKPIHAAHGDLDNEQLERRRKELERQAEQLGVQRNRVVL